MIADDWHLLGLRPEAGGFEMARRDAWAARDTPPERVVVRHTSIARTLATPLPTNATMCAEDAIYSGAPFADFMRATCGDVTHNHILMMTARYDAGEGFWWMAARRHSVEDQVSVTNYLAHRGDAGALRVLFARGFAWDRDRIWRQAIEDGEVASLLIDIGCYPPIDDDYYSDFLEWARTADPPCPREALRRVLVGLYR